MEEPIGDAEAYGHSLKDDEEVSDAMEDDLDDFEKDLEALEKKLIDDDQSGDGDDNDSIDDSYE